MNEYPEHEKLSAVRDESQAIGEFLDWLNHCRNYRLCSHSEGYLGQAKWEPIYLTIEKVLAEYYKIDLSALEAEKQHMLDAIRTQNLAQDLAAGN